MAEKEKDSSSESSGRSTCPDLKYNENDSLSTRRALMVNNRWLSDVTFIVGPEQQRIYAHKQHLVPASKYFHILFYGNFAEARLDEIELKEEDPDMFLTILRLIYGAHVTIDTDNVRAIYDRMQLYLLPQSCIKLVIDFWMNLLSKDTVMQVWRENEYFKFRMVDEMCLRYVRNNPLHCFKNEDFTSVSRQAMLKIVGLQRINCTAEQLRAALEKWKQANPETDSKKLVSAMDGTLRTYACEKMCVVPSLTELKYYSVACFTLQAKHIPVTLHGISVCVKFESNFTSDAVLALKVDQPLIQMKVKLSQRKKPSFDVVDLMFEEIVLRPQKHYCFRLEGDFISIVSCKSHFSVEDEQIQISYRSNYGTPAISHLWVSPSE